MVVVNVSSGESTEGVSGGLVEGSQSKTLGDNYSDKGVLSEGVRVSDEESNGERLISGIGVMDPVESIGLRIDDPSRKRDVEVRASANRWDSWGVMNMVGRVLEGKFGMDDDEVEELDTLRNRRGGDRRNAWRGVIGERANVSRGDENVVADGDAWQGGVGETGNVDRSDENVVADGDTWREGVIGEQKNVDKIDEGAWNGAVGETDNVDRSDENVVADGDSWQGVIGEPANVDKIDENVVADGDAWTGAVGEPENVDKSDENIVADGDKWKEGVTAEPENVDKSDENVVADVNTWQGVTGEPENVDKSDENVVAEGNTWQGVIGEPENAGKIDEDVVVDGNTWQGVIGEPINASKSDVEMIDVDGDFDELILLDGLVEGMDINGNQDSVSNELVPYGALESEEVNDVKGDAFLMPKIRGEHDVTEKEGEYYVSDLVWGKVRSHPWWPGQIFAPIDASDKAKKHFRKGSHLIAYFGDQTFAWNEGSKIKPFRTYFSQMEKQSNVDVFCHAVGCALDEVARRVEFGLSCPCLPEEVRDKIKFQEVSNAGISDGNSTKDCADNLFSAACFIPGKLVQFLESMAECPQSKTDRLQFTIAKAELLAFKSWKGSKLPVFEQYNAWPEDVTLVALKEKENVSLEVMSSKKRKSTARDDSSQKRKHLSVEKEFPTIKEKRMSALMSSSTSALPNVDGKPVKRTDRSSSVAGDSKVKRRKSLLPNNPNADVAAPQRKTPVRAGDGEKSHEATLSSGGESQLVEIIPADIPTPDVILSKLMLAAKVPMQGFNVMVSEVDFLREFRNLICLEKSNSGNSEVGSGKNKGKQLPDSESTDTFGFEGMEDSYWTDRIIQSYSQDQVLFEPKNPNDKAAQVEGAYIGGVMNLDDNKEKDTVVLNLNSDSEKASEDYRRTALVLNFSNLDSIPPVANLNEIFTRFGPLNESETEILTKSKRAKVIFKRPADAETAFSSTGKYKTFGPSLVSYRLHYAPKPRKSRGTSKKNKKVKSPKVDA